MFGKHSLCLNDYLPNLLWSIEMVSIDDYVWNHIKTVVNMKGQFQEVNPVLKITWLTRFTLYTKGFS